ncbi:MAG: hypothetical protein WEC37_03130 [Anaerolineales bacterium]
MEVLKKLHIGLLIGLIAGVAIVFLLLASLVEDTGFPGGMAKSSRDLIYAITAFILSLTGWATVWRKEMYVTDLQKVIKGKMGGGDGGHCGAAVFGGRVVVSHSGVCVTNPIPDPSP